jgi:hypothetical protein
MVRAFSGRWSAGRHLVVTAVALPAPGVPDLEDRRRAGSATAERRSFVDRAQAG